MALYHSARGSNNYTIVGTPTVVDNVVSDFSSSNYILAANSFAPTGAWEIIIKIKTPNGNASKYFIGGGGYNFAIGTTNTPANHFKAFFSANGTSWNIGNITSSLAISNNVWYYVRIGFTGKQYYMDYSTDGKNYIDRVTKASTAKLYASSFLLGQTGIFPTLFWNGEIDLKATYAFVDGQPFCGICPVEVKKHQLMGPVGYTVVGSPTITNGVVSNLSIDDYLRLDSSFSADSSWEIISKVKPDNINATKYFIAGQSRSIAIGTTNNPIGYLKAFFSSDGTSWDIGSIVDTEKLTSSNTWYYVKVGYDGQQYYLEHSTDGITYKGRATIESSLRIKTDDILIGKSGLFATSCYWGGEVDLNETYISKQGKLWYWQPRETERIVVNGVEVWSKPQES
jgi:hypothetical protein